MLITLTRTGGFTGIPQKKTIDTTKLPPEEAGRIEKLVSNVPFDSAQGKNNPDRFTYSLSIQNGATTAYMKLDEASLPQQVRELIKILGNAS